MNIRAPSVVSALAAMLVAGCASSGYSPPPERRGGDRCPAGEVWVCEDRFPSRIEDEDERDTFCRCENVIP